MNLFGGRVPCIRAGRTPVGPLRVPAGRGAAASGAAARRAASGAGSGSPTGRTWSRGSRPRSVDWNARHAVSSWPSVCSGLRAEARRGRMLPYVIEVDGQFCGQLTIGNVTHGALRSAWIGYWVASAVTGGGVATGALALGLDHCFGPVMLHRVEATVRPENAASRAVLAKVGFREEGLLQRYLDVDGAWRDHLLVAMTIEEVTGSVTSALVRGPRELGVAPPRGCARDLRGGCAHARGARPWQRARRNLLPM